MKFYEFLVSTLPRLRRSRSKVNSGKSTSGSPTITDARNSEDLTITFNKSLVTDDFRYANTDNDVINQASSTDVINNNSPVESPVLEEIPPLSLFDEEEDGGQWVIGEGTMYHTVPRSINKIRTNPWLTSPQPSRSPTLSPMSMSGPGSPCSSAARTPDDIFERVVSVRTIDGGLQRHRDLTGSGGGIGSGEELYRRRRQEDLQSEGYASYNSLSMMESDGGMETSLDSFSSISRSIVSETDSTESTKKFTTSQFSMSIPPSQMTCEVGNKKDVAVQSPMDNGNGFFYDVQTYNISHDRSTRLYDFGQNLDNDFATKRAENKLNLCHFYENKSADVSENIPSQDITKPQRVLQHQVKTAAVRNLPMVYTSTPVTQPTTMDISESVSETSEPTGRSLAQISSSLQEKVTRLRQDKRLVDEIVRHAREEERIRARTLAKFRQQAIVMKKEMLLKTLTDLRQMLDSQSKRLQCAYDTVLARQWPKAHAADCCGRVAMMI